MKAEVEVEASEQDEEYGIKPEVAITEETERKKNRFSEDEFEGEISEEEELDDKFEGEDIEGENSKQQ
jgi:hypothetical protein